ncbi:MAG: tetratricopeptide repeat protein [Salinibacter sp.]
MRWLLLLVLGATLPAGAAAPPDSLDQIYERATAAYRQGQYARAATLYRDVLETGHASGALYYNLGNAYVRLGRLGPAIRYYEKARRLRPNDPRLRHNLEQARRRAGVYPEQLGQGPPRTLADLVRAWPPWLLLGSGALLLGGGLVAAAVGTGPDRPDAWRRPAVWGPVAGGLLLAAVALSTSYVQSLRGRAVVVDDTVAVRATPSAEAAADTTLPEGTLVEVRRRRAQWRAVRLADGTTGWVPAQALGDV